MQSRLPIRNLIVLNSIIAVMTSVLVFIYVAVITHSVKDAGGRLVQVALIVSITGLCNVALRVLYPGEARAQSWFVKMKFYLSSYLAAYFVWWLIKIMYSWLTATPWEGENSRILISYALAALAITVFNTLILVLQDLVILQYRQTQGEIENLQLKANISETTNLLLRQQIHPHFLFNALNTIKSLYKKDLQQGEEYLVHLANFLRASISNHNEKTTLIKNELEFCLDYLKMQKIRFGSALDYSISISDKMVNCGCLPFFSLQTLAENVLKHNDLTEESPILITIREDNGYLVVSNNIQPRSYKEPSTGLGLYNLAERYRLLGEEEIIIDDSDNFFTVRIKILYK